MSGMLEIPDRERRNHRARDFSQLSVRRNKGNVLISHEDCNTEKGNRPPTGREQALLQQVNREIERIRRMKR